MTDFARECAAEALYRACGLRPTGTQWDDDERTRRRWRANLDGLANDGWTLISSEDLDLLVVAAATGAMELTEVDRGYADAVWAAVARWRVVGEEGS